MKINEFARKNPVMMLFRIMTIFPVSIPEKQKMLELDGFDNRLKFVNTLVKEKLKEIETNKSDLDAGKQKLEDERSQAIKKFISTNKGGSLGGFGKSQSRGASEDEIAQLRVKLDECKLPEETQKIVDQELKKVESLDSRNQEYHVSLNYLQTISNLPWNKSQPENNDPSHAQEVLDKDHFGLEKVKKRIVQFLAVRKLKNNNQGTILCLSGPPGVGKTSLGKSVAEALGRKFYKIALGGVRDEALIRGHRRTYVGSMPGVIIQSLIKIQTNNPVFLLDEIDKLGHDSRNGDPGAALLEVLDPNQNDQFTDHFLGTPFNLSNVIFIATANVLDTIHPALLDRMELIELSGYTLQEKLQISKRYLVPKQIKDNGLKPELIQFTDGNLQKIIMEYTAESGVRNLERSIGTVCRSVAYDYAISKAPETFKQVEVNDALIEEALGNRKYDHQLKERIMKPGVAIGLAYTSIGGSALLVETTMYPGSGQLKLTGKLGEVMRESVNTSISWI